MSISLEQLTIECKTFDKKEEPRKMWQESFEKFPKIEKEQVLVKQMTREFIIISDNSRLEERDFGFQRRGSSSMSPQTIYNFSDLDNDDLFEEFFIVEEDESKLSPTIARKNLFEENPNVNLDLVKKVVEHILSEELDTLASLTQQCTNTNGSMVLWMDSI